MSKIEVVSVVRLEGIKGGENASAADLWRDRLLVAADEITDEGNAVQVFEPLGRHYRAVKDGLVVLDAPGEDVREMDLEGLAIDGDDIYVLGSHSTKRKKVDPKKPYAKNRADLLKPAQAEPARDVLLRFRLDDSGEAGPIERTSLRSYLVANEPFKSFLMTASKENGIDAEGLCHYRKRIYVGFRGPVLRGNFTPIVRCRFGVPTSEHELLFVDLGGLGVRDLASADEGILILAGPVGDGPGSYQLYLWDGRDMVPGKGAPNTARNPTLTLLGELPPPAGNPQAKAEGLALLEEKSRFWDLLVVYDGLTSGHATRFRVGKP